MFVRLDHKRILHVPTGTLLVCDREPSPVVRYVRLDIVRYDDALAVIDAIDEALRQQEEPLLEQRFGLSPNALGCLEESEVAHPLPGRQVPAEARIVH